MLREYNELDRDPPLESVRVRAYLTLHVSRISIDFNPGPSILGMSITQQLNPALLGKLSDSDLRKFKKAFNILNLHPYDFEESILDYAAPLWSCSGACFKTEESIENDHPDLPANDRTDSASEGQIPDLTHEVCDGIEVGQTKLNDYDFTAFADGLSDTFEDDNEESTSFDEGASKLDNRSATQLNREEYGYCEVKKAKINPSKMEQLREVRVRLQEIEPKLMILGCDELGPY